MGRPHDVEMQRAIAGHALDLFETASLPRTTVQVPITWSDDTSWKASFARVDASEIETMRRMGEQRRQRQKHVGN